MASKRKIKSALESMMFTWGELLPAKDAADALNITEKEAIESLEELKEEYEQEDRGIRIRRVNKSFQFVTEKSNAEYIERLCRPVKKRRLSQSALEVLAIVAYKQPVTRAEIEAVRGIRCERVLEGLSAKQLVEEKGRSNAIGRPILYGTTETFLKYFGYSTLGELPDIDDIEDIIEMPEGYEDAVTPGQITFDEMGEAESDGAAGSDAAKTASESGEAEGAEPDEKDEQAQTL